MVIEKLNTSKSEPGKPPYRTKYDTSTGTAWCSCRGWIYNKQAPKRCRHTDDLVAEVRAGQHPEPAPLPLPPPPAPRATLPAPLPPPVGSLVGAHPRPMLASAMTKGQSLDLYMNERHVLEVKKDGFRVTVRKAGARLDAFSRPQAGKDANRRDLPRDIDAAFRLLPDGLYDGELLIPGTTSARATHTHFALFDVLEVLGESVISRPYHERRALLEMAVAHYTTQTDGRVLEVVEALAVTAENIAALFARGEEGGIIKRVDSRYRPGFRSPDWLKVKRAGAETVTITGFERGKAASSTPYSVTLFRRDNGMEGRCATKDTATLQQIAANPDAFLGRRLVVSYIELQPSGAMRSPGWDHLAGMGE